MTLKHEDLITINNCLIKIVEIQKDVSSMAYSLRKIKKAQSKQNGQPPQKLTALTPPESSESIESAVVHTQEES